MFAVKHSIYSAAGLLGGIFGYVSAPTETLAWLAAFGCMLGCAFVADFMTSTLEVDEDE